MTSGGKTELVRVRREAFGSRLRQHRARLNLSQQTVADRAGIDRGFYSQVESAKRSLALDRVYDLAAALEVHITQLLED